MGAQGTAVVTGASTGIGRVIALHLADRGWDVVVNSIRDAAAGEETAATIAAKGRWATYCQADVSNDGEARSVADAALNRSGPTLLVNNAGATRPCSVADWSAEHWDDMLRTNLVSAALMTTAALNAFGDSLRSVVNIASVRGMSGAPRPAIAAYCAAKAGLVSLTQSLARELAPRVTVNCISPGFVHTEYMQRVARSQVQAWTDAMPAKRFVTADEVAETVLFLAGRRDLTGANLVLDGGWSATRP
jgi:3-oxoacyl-[acyl-carrier protein] reductase